jgi:sugar-specific transcriptional regulator TrmB
MSSSTSEPMPQTIEAYKALAQRDHDLIAEMKAEHQAEVSKLKSKINKLEQKYCPRMVRARSMTLPPFDCSIDADGSPNL